MEGYLPNTMDKIGYIQEKSDETAKTRLLLGKI
jgi:hypothetical protein